MKQKNLFFLAPILAIAVLFNIGCNNSQNPVSPNDNNSPGRVSMMSKYSSSPATGLNKSDSVQGIDSIEIISARLVLKDVKLEGTEKEHESDQDGNDNSVSKIDCRDEVNFKTGPFVLNLNLSGAVQQVTVTDIPFGTYRKVKFKIHSIKQSDLDSLSSSEQLQFAEFLADGGYSIIIEGNSYESGTPTPFTFKSSLNTVMEIEFSPVLIVDSTNTNPNLTLEISSDSWFKAYDGSLLDPNDQQNNTRIEENIKRSVHVYKDCDRDGRKDRD